MTLWAGLPDVLPKHPWIIISPLFITGLLLFVSGAHLNDQPNMSQMSAKYKQFCPACVAGPPPLPCPLRCQLHCRLRY